MGLILWFAGLVTVSIAAGILSANPAIGFLVAGIGLLITGMAFLIGQ